MTPTTITKPPTVTTRRAFVLAIGGHEFVLTQQMANDLRRQIGEFNKMLPHANSIQSLIQVVADHYDCSVDSFMRRTRSEPHVTRRHQAISLCSRELDYSQNQLAVEFKCDRGTITHALRRVELLMETEPKFRAEMIALHARCNDKVSA